MKIVQLAVLLAAIAVAFPLTQRVLVPLPEQDLAPGSVPNLAPLAPPALPQAEISAPVLLEKNQARLPKEDDTVSSIETVPSVKPQQPVQETAQGTAPPKQDLTYLADYAYSEVPPETKPADTVKESLKGIPVGTPIEEIERAADAFGIDFNFMMAVAKIESNFGPTQRTGSYLGLFQLSNYEFEKYGSGDIYNPRDNAIAAAYKFTTAAILFELDTHQKATRTDLYLIHQQGTQGAAEHVSHPDRIAWESMCATDEGRLKGEKWCKRAIWQNTLPGVKSIWKSVDNLTSGEFVKMWRQRIALFLSRYSRTATAVQGPVAFAGQHDDYEAGKVSVLGAQWRRSPDTIPLRN
jgi:hypothetical protein